MFHDTVGRSFFAKRQVIEWLVYEHRISVQRACRTVGLSRAAYYRGRAEPYVAGE